jgi:hypothetical protein
MLLPPIEYPGIDIDEQELIDAFGSKSVVRKAMNGLH